MRPLLFALLLPVCLISEAFGAPPAQADADATFTRANADYAAGKFPSAIEGYESLVKSGQWNPSLFYNLGNAYFRTDDLGHAILNYERALALDPSQPEARANLALVRDRARALELQTGWAEEHLDFLTRDQYAWLATVAFWIAVAIAAGLYFSKRRPVVWIFALLLSGVIAVGAAIAVYLLETGSAGYRSRDCNRERYPGAACHGGERRDGPGPAARKRNQDSQHARELGLRGFA